MSRLIQNAMSVADSGQVTISLWFKITAPSMAWSDAPDTPIPLIEWGDFDDSTLRLGSGLYWVPRPVYVPQSLIGGQDDSWPSWSFQVLGATGSVAVSGLLTGDWDDNPFSPYTSAGGPAERTWPAGDKYWQVSNGSFTPCYQAWGFMGTDFSPPNLLKDQWHHVLLAVDTDNVSIGHAVLHDVVTGPEFVIYIDGTDQSPLNKDGGYFNASNLLPTLGALEVRDPTFPNFEAGNGEESGGWQVVSSAQNYAVVPAVTNVAGTWTYTIPGDPPTDEELDFFGTAELDVPAFDIAFNGKKIGLPGFHNPNYKVQMADVQLWTKFIDPRDHIGKFINFSGGHGTPVDTSIPAAAFGRQIFLFKGGRGGRTAFVVNQGTGGTFVQTGALTDESGPSF